MWSCSWNGKEGGPTTSCTFMKLAVVWIVLDELIGHLALKRTLGATGQTMPTRVRQSQTHPVPD